MPIGRPRTTEALKNDYPFICAKIQSVLSLDFGHKSNGNEILMLPLTFHGKCLTG